MKKILLVALCLLGSQFTFAQSETAAIKQTINTMFDAMRKNDSTLLKSTFAKDMILQSVVTKDGMVKLITEKADDFAKMVAVPRKDVADERVTLNDNDIKIDGDLASVWTPYKLYFGSKFSHCGVDVFQLMKTTDGKWKIIYIVDTRRKDNCPE